MSSSANPNGWYWQLSEPQPVVVAALRRVAAEPHGLSAASRP